MCYNKCEINILHVKLENSPLLKYSVGIFWAQLTSLYHFSKSALSKAEMGEKSYTISNILISVAQPIAYTSC